MKSSCVALRRVCQTWIRRLVSTKSNRCVARSRYNRSRLPFPVLCSAACAAPRREENGRVTAERIKNGVRDQPGSKCQASTPSDTPAPTYPPPQAGKVGGDLSPQAAQAERG